MSASGVFRLREAEKDQNNRRNNDRVDDAMVDDADDEDGDGENEKEEGGEERAGEHHSSDGCGGETEGKKERLLGIESLADGTAQHHAEAREEHEDGRDDEEERFMAPF
jgi:hypothetical protein